MIARQAAAATGPAQLAGPRHVRVSGRLPMFRYERCAASCVVLADGSASGCGELACPACGSGGSNLALTATSPGDEGRPARASCTCGHVWFAWGR